MIERHEVPVITRAVGRFIREYVSNAIASIVKRIDEFETRIAVIPAGPAGPNGERGADGKTPEVEPIIAAVLQKIPPPRDGRDGPSGADGKTPDTEAIIAAVVRQIQIPKDGERGIQGEKGDTPELEPIIAAVLQRIPPPRDGRDGTNGTNGRDGQNVKGDPGESGKDAVPTDEKLIRQLVAEEVQRAVGAIPKPADGRDGVDGRNGSDGVGIVGPVGPAGQTGERGPSGETGRAPTQEEIRACVEIEFSKFALDCERRLSEVADRTLQRAIDKMPLPKDGVDGKNGRDALDLEDLSMSLDDDGFLHFSYKRGGLEKAFEIYLPIVSDKGVYKKEYKYLRQNGVTHSGSFWIAQVDNPSEGPGVGSQWRLAVKSGRNGIDGKSIKGDQGPPGPPGKDLRYE